VSASSSGTSRPSGTGTVDDADESAAAAADDDDDDDDDVSTRDSLDTPLDGDDDGVSSSTPPYCSRKPVSNRALLVSSYRARHPSSRGSPPVRARD